MKKIFLLFSLSLLSSIWLYSQEGKIKFTEYDLPNGLHVILHEDHTTPNVAVSVLYHVGSKNEDPMRTGFAHFFEHLLFEGTEHIGRGEYMNLIQSNGGMINANTSFDRTFYFEVVPSNYTQMALWMESERMHLAKIDTLGLETQRKVVKEEKKLRYDNSPYGHMIEQIFKYSFDVHPYKWMPIGSEQYIDQASLQEFIDFYHTFYVPNNATLSIAGDLDIDKTKKWVESYFAGIPKGTVKIPRPTEVEPTWTVQKSDTFYDNIQFPALAVSYHIPDQKNPDFYAMDMLTTLLSNGKSSRLYKKMVDEKQYCLQSGSFSFGTEDPGLAIFYNIVKPNIDIDTVLNALDLEIKKMQTTLISDAELQKIKTQQEDNFASQVSSVKSISELLANYYTYYGNTNLINTEINKYMKVTKEDIQRVAKKYLIPTNRNVLYYLPKS